MFFGIGLWEDDEKFKTWWGQSFHLIGKDILITHGVYWPCLLMALDLPLPRQIISHGWLLNKEQEKMSKSQGDILDPLYLIQKAPVDSVRYFFAKSARLGQDSPISIESVIKEHNQDLANNLGNLFQRTITLVSSYFGKIPPHSQDSENMQKQAFQTCDLVREKILNLQIHSAVFEVMKLLDTANRYLEETAPWKLARSDLKKTALILRNCLEIIRIATNLLQPVIPESAEKILKKLGAGCTDFEQTKKWNQLKTDFPIQKSDPVFPRIKP